jgi:ubiquitin-activating enzyme E1
MKAVAMTGLGTKGKVFVTDDDQIELSNLNRQFLFRRKHVGKAKSTSAASVVRDMNHDLKTSLVDLELRVEPKTEDKFDDSFWESLDFVVNALDNNIARQYTDGKCVLYGKPLFESGTLGTKANNAICLPHKTPSYSEGVVAGEGQGIAKCTLRNFPSMPLHCIEWAREMFDEWFVSGPDLFNSLVENKDAFLAQAQSAGLEELSTLRAAKQWLELSQKRSLETVVGLMFDKFVKYYHHGIKDLTHAFPEDAQNIEKGTGASLGPFWHGSKRFPRVASFDCANQSHVDFIFDGSFILADVFGIPAPTRDQVKAICEKLQVPQWVPTGVQIDLDEDKKEAKDDEEKDDEEEKEPQIDEEDAKALEDLRQEFKSLDLSKATKFRPADFEKDDDSNHHIDLITQATNLRSYNYHLKESTRAHCRLTAGKILPALATTTACITGFVQLEIYKHIKGVSLDDYRAATINLAMNVFCCENLPDPIKTKSGMDQATYMPVVAIPEGFTVWDTVDIKGELTLQGFLDEFKKQHHGAVIDMLASQQKVLYNETIGVNASEEALNTKLIDLYVKLCGPVFPVSRNYIVFDSICCEDESGDTGVVPRVRYYFK